LSNVAHTHEIDLGDGEKVTVTIAAPEPEEAVKFDLFPHLFRLMRDEPVLGAMCRRITKRATTTVETAGVTVENEQLYLYYNPIWMAKIAAEDERNPGGILRHELFHLMLDHCTYRKKEPYKAWNVAVDAAVNSLIDRDLLPIKGIHPGELTGKGPVHAMVATWSRGKSAEYYFNELMNAIPADDPIWDDDDFAICDCGEHDMWDKMSKEKASILKGRIRQLLKDSVLESKRLNKGWGSIPSHIQRELEKLLSRQVDWKSMLREFMGMVRQGRRSSSVRRINRRFPYTFPGFTRGYTANLAICIDESGSMTDKEVALFFGELESLSKQITFTVIPFDSSVSEEDIFVWTRGSKPPAVRALDGGTSFEAPTRYVNEHANIFDGVVFLTDSGAWQPSASKVRRAWILTPGVEKLPWETDEKIITMEWPNA